MSFDTQKPHETMCLGVIAAGTSLSEAMLGFQSTALGQNAKAYVDPTKSFVFASNLDKSPFNPVTGLNDLKLDPSLLSSMSFQSKSSTEVLPVRLLLCSEGCGNFIVTDADLRDVRHCVLCSAPVNPAKQDDDSILDGLDLDDLQAASLAPVLASEDIRLNDVHESGEAEDDENGDEEAEDDENEDDENEDEETEDDENVEGFDAESSSTSDPSYATLLASNSKVSTKAKSVVAGFSALCEGMDETDFGSMSDEDIAAFEEKIGHTEASQQSLSASLGDDQDPAELDQALLDSDIDVSAVAALRKDLLTDVKRQALQASSKESGKTTSKAQHLMVTAKTQKAARDAYTSALLNLTPIVSMSSATHSYYTSAKHTQAFKYDPFSAEPILGKKLFAENRQPVMMEAMVSLSGDVGSQPPATELYSQNNGGVYRYSAEIFQCCACDMFTVTSAADPHHCPSCGGSLVDPEYIEEGIEPVLHEGVASEDAELSDPFSAESTDAEVLDFNEDDLGDGVEEDEDDLGDGASVTAGADSKEEDDEEPEEEGAEEPEEEGAEELDDLSAEEEGQVTASAKGKTLTVGAVNTALASAESDKDYQFLNVVYCGALTGADSEGQLVTTDTWLAFYKTQPIAYASTHAQVKHKDLFHSPAFSEAVLASAKVNGIRRALTDMGFKTLKNKVKVKENINVLVASAVKKSQKDVEADFKAKSQEYDDRLLSALSTAAMGLNRGFFAGMVSPIKAALWNSLSAAGIQNPEVLIDSVFNAQADAYHKVLFTKAKEIVAKPLEIQNELATAVMGTNYACTSSASTTQTLETHLSSLGTPVAGAPAAPEENVALSSATSDNTRMLRVVSGLSRRDR